MIKTQVQIPDELYREAKRMAKEREWSFAELVRRGLEQMVLRRPVHPLVAAQEWKLPEPLDLGLRGDPFEDPDWREEANLSHGMARLMAEQLREQAARYGVE
jgi:hypothetical protein